MPIVKFSGNSDAKLWSVQTDDGRTMIDQTVETANRRLPVGAQGVNWILIGNAGDKLTFTAEQGAVKLMNVKDEEIMEGDASANGAGQMVVGA